MLLKTFVTVEKMKMWFKRLRSSHTYEEGSFCELEIDSVDWVTETKLFRPE